MNGTAMPPMAHQAQSAASVNSNITNNNRNIMIGQQVLTEIAVEVIREKYEILQNHIEKIHRLAGPFKDDGVLVCASFGQDPATGISLIPQIGHFEIGEIEKNVRWIEERTTQERRNVYMSLAIYRHDLPKKNKGCESDIIAVMGLVADFDDADAANWKNRIPLPPSYCLETSPGRYQVGFLFDTPILPPEAKELAVALKAFCKCDHGTADISHVWRIPGTLNWPNKKKVNEGRSTEPCTVKALDIEPVLVDPAEFADIIKSSKVTLPINNPAKQLYNPESLDELIDSLRLNQATKELIQEGAQVGKRSEAMQTVLCSLAGAGVSDDDINEIFEEYQIGEKYREKGDNRKKWLKPQIDKAREFVKKPDVEELRVEITEKISAGNLTDEIWTELLYSANLSPSDIDKILDFLVALEVGKKQTLKTRYNERKKELDKIEARQRKARIVAQAGRNKKTIFWDTKNLNSMVEQTEAALLSTPGKLPYLQYADSLCYVTTETPSASHAIDSPNDKPPAVSVIKRYCSNSLRLSIEERVCFIQEKEDGPEQIPVPKELSNLLLDYPSSKASVTTGLINHPLVTCDGRFINHQGYDPATQLYFNYGGSSFPPLETGDRERAGKIFDQIVENMFDEFAWENWKLDRAIAVSIFLTILLRKLMDIAPAYLVTANLQGSGKTTLLRIIHIVATGHDMPVSTLSEDTQEVRKSMLALLMESAAMIAFDNVPDGFEVRNDVLAKVITSPFFKDRLLGATKQVSVPTKSVIALTGNNITMDADLVRRFVPLGLLPKELMPEKRHFKHPDILEWSRSIRIAMITKALSIVSMYLNADCKEYSGKIANSGFPMWDKMVRFPILWASGVDVVDAIDKARMSSNDLVNRNAALSALSKAFPSRVKFSASDVFKIIDHAHDSPAEDVRDTFMEMSHNTARNVSSVGWALKKLLNYPSSYGTLNRTTTGHSNKYFLEPKEQRRS